MPHATQIHLTDDDVTDLVLIACGGDESLELLDFQNIDKLYDRGLVVFNHQATPQIRLTAAGQAQLPESIRNQAS